MTNNTSDFLNWRTGARAGLPALFSAGLIWLFFDRITYVDFAQVFHDIAGFGLSAWLMAILFTIISFAAVSRYDPLVTTHLGMDVPHRRAASMSWKAIAISQIVGFGLISGTIIRWLELSLNPNQESGQAGRQAFKLTLSVTAAFLMAGAIVTLLTLTWVKVGPLYALAVTCGGVVFYEFLKVTRTAIHRTVAHFLAFTFLDTAFAALVIFAFLPPDTLPFATLFLAFLMAYAAGLMSGLPGGVGPFEICIIAFLPQVDIAVLAPALVGFRLVYFGLPALTAILFMSVNLRAFSSKLTSGIATPDVPSKLIGLAPAQADLLWNTALTCRSTSDQTDAALVQTSDRAVIQLGDRFGGFKSDTRIQEHLCQDAVWSKRSFCIYRCNKSTMLEIKKQGFKSLRFSTEAVIDPMQFDLRSPSLAALRRKIRKSGRAGLTVNSQPASMHTLTKLDQDWIQNHGQVRGFSTGQFSPELISRQRIYTAFLDNKPVAFVTFSTTNSEWLLDLMRYGDTCPDGATYALVAQAIEDARLNGVTRVSLGSVPFAPPVQAQGFIGGIFRRIYDGNGSLKGLYQFKKTFDPIWQDRFYATRSPISFIVGIWTIRCAIFSIETKPKHAPQS